MFDEYRCESDLIRWRRVSTRALAIVVSVLLVGFLGVPDAAHATSNFQATLAVDVDFGSSVTFRLNAPWEQSPPSSVSVLFGLSDGLGRKRTAAEFRVVDGRLTASGNWRASGLLAPGAEVEYWFEVGRGDEMVQTSAITFTYLNENVPWRRFSEGPVDIWSHTGDSGTVAAVRRGVREALLLLDTEFGLQITRPTRLVIYTDADRMRSALGAGTRSWVGGAALSSFNVTVLHVSEHAAETDELAAVIAHELTHVIVDHAARNPFGYVPAWLHEGLATMVESSVFERFKYDEIMKEAVESNEFVTLRGITGSFPAQGRRAVQAYAQSKSLVGFIIDRWGVTAINRILVAYSRGVADATAIRGALGVSVEDLEEQWLASVGVTNPRFSALSSDSSASPDVAFPRRQSQDGRSLDRTGLVAIVTVSAAAMVIGLSLTRMKWWKTRT